MTSSSRRPVSAGSSSSDLLRAIPVLKLQKVLRATPEIEMSILLRNGDALITRARADLGRAVSSTNSAGATHLLFVDADIGFEPDQVIRLLGCGADMCSGVYPIKRTDWDRVRRVIEAGRPNPGAAALDYVLEVEDPQHIVMRGGFVRVRYAGTGFLMIRRAALDEDALRALSARRCSSAASIRPTTRWPTAPTASPCSNA